MTTIDLRKSLPLALMAVTVCGVGCSKERDGASMTTGPGAPASGPAAPGTMDGTGGTLELTASTRENIAGVYRRDGRGIRFASSRTTETTSFDLQTLDRRPMLRVEDSGVNVRLIVAGEYSETVRKVDLSNLRDELAKGKPMANPGNFMKMKAEGIRDSATAKLEDLPEYAIMPWLSRALGRAGFTGNLYPSAYPLHLMARSIAQAKGINVPTIVPAEQSADEDQIESVEQALFGRCIVGLKCSNGGACCTIRNCPGGNCRGMCGPDCNCWSWVCGDCCAYTGCYAHDRWCGHTTAECVANFWYWFAFGGCTPMWGL